MSTVIDLFLYPLAPYFSVTIAALLLIFVECFPGGSQKGKPVKYAIALLGAASGLFFSWMLLHSPPTPLGSDAPVWVVEFAKHYRLDSVSLYFYGAISLFTLLSLIFMNSRFTGSDIRTEIFTLVLFIAGGMMLLVSADSLLMVFMAIELLSLPTYVLVGIQRRDKRSSEAALKYFLFGSFATVLLVFGITLLYAHFNTLSIPKIASMLQGQALEAPTAKALVYGGMALLSIAIAFKVGIAPFHMWVPDVYQGAASPVTGFMGSAIKLAGFGLAIRVMWGMFLPLADHWSNTLAVLAVITMFVGNIAALAQDNLKRMFAYSSVSHAGYLLLGIASVGTSAPQVSALSYYLVVYGLMFLGLFGILTLIERQTRSTDIYALSGMGFSHPLLGLCLALFSLSGAGIPPTAGFFAKYFVFLDAVRAGKTTFVVLGLISSAIGIYYYLRVIVYLYMKEARERMQLGKVGPLAYIGIVVCAIAMFFFSVTPNALNIATPNLPGNTPSAQLR